LPLFDVLKNAKRRLWEIMIKDKKVLLLCVFLTLIFITAVGAAVYNYMFMKSSVGVSS